jgi:tetratricopeptide (TPR) repeat protein
MLGITDAHIAHGKMDLTYGTVGHQRYDSEYVLSRKPDIVALELGQHILGFNPAEVNTENIHRQIQPGEAWFPAPADLIGRRAFRLDYAPRVAEVEPDKYFVFFERDPTLREMIARIPLDSPDPKAHFALGMRLRKHGLLDEAVTRMRRAAALDPRRSLAPALNAGYFLLEAGRTEEALNAFRALATRAPEEPQVRYGLALVLHRLERYREAIPAWKRYLAIGRNPRFTRKAQQMLAEAENRAVNE